VVIFFDFVWKYIKRSVERQGNINQETSVRCHKAGVMASLIVVNFHN